MTIQTADISSFAKSIIVVSERLGVDVDTINLNNTFEDIISKFKSISDNDISLALRNGSLGDYGQTYKLNTQIICIWIKTYLKDKKANIKYTKQRFV